jgi:hypothetical protein
MEKEMSIAMILDDYKLKNKDDWWAKCMSKRPDIERDYEFVREEILPGITKNTVSVIRHYKLKAKS